MAFCVKSGQLLPFGLSSLRSSIYSCSLVPSRGLIYLAIAWKRPDRLPFCHPIKTGDTVTRVELDMNKMPIEVEQSKELEKCNDLVKKLFTFNFLGSKYAYRRATVEAAMSVANHKYDQTSLEVLIAKKTVKIRHHLESLEAQPSNKDVKSILNYHIYKRRRYLRQLRSFDYKRYEWLLEKLDLVYTPHPEVKEYVYRKRSIRRLADKYCEEYRANKLTEYRQSLEAKMEDFLRKKVETLRWIRQEEAECGVKPTVSEEDIRAAEEKLERHLQELISRPVLIDEKRNVLSDV